ncbi:hypothetical protein HDU98_009977, partial [Podochytrium sp. JEL0797]
MLGFRNRRRPEKGSGFTIRLQNSRLVTASDRADPDHEKDDEASKGTTEKLQAGTVE